MRKLMMAAAFALPMFGAAAMAQETLKIGYIDPLSGGGASVGEVGLKTFQFLADEVNAKGGIQGKKVEIVPLDNKTNPQESLIQAQKAIDAGVRYLTQGNGSSVAGALSDFVTKYNERNPGKEVLYFNYAAVDPVLTNAKCSFWHFRWDANSDIKMEALTNYMKTAPVDQECLSDQPGLLVRRIRPHRRQGHAGRQAAGHQDRRRRTASAAEDHRFLALHRQDQGVGRRYRRDRQLGPGFRAAAEGGRRRRTEGELVHLLCRRHRRPDRDQAGQSQSPGVPGREGIPNLDHAASQEFEKAIRAKYDVSLFYPRAVNEMRMLAAAADKAKSIDPVKVAQALEGMEVEVLDGGKGNMRKDDHQFFQPIYISSLGDRTDKEPFDEEKTGWGWKLVARIDTPATVLPTTCKMERPN